MTSPSGGNTASRGVGVTFGPSPAPSRTAVRSPRTSPGFTFGRAPAPAPSLSAYPAVAPPLSVTRRTTRGIISFGRPSIPTPGRSESPPPRVGATRFIFGATRLGDSPPPRVAPGFNFGSPPPVPAPAPVVFHFGAPAPAPPVDGPDSDEDSSGETSPSGGFFGAPAPAPTGLFGGAPPALPASQQLEVPVAPPPPAVTTKPTDDESTNEPSAKRQKSSIVDDLICPIMLALPFVPVVAEDGRVYERSAIENYFATKSANRVKSPVTSVMISKKLVPAPQHRGIIETSIDNGTITGDLARKWLEKAKEKKDMEDLLKRAEDGEVEAMLSAGHNYRFAAGGFTKDAQKAYKWLSKAHEAGSVQGTACFGHMLALGTSVAQNKIKGVMLLGMAAAKGSNWAAYQLGMILADGKYGIPTDVVEAKTLLQMSLSTTCAYQHLKDGAKVKAQEKLEELE